MKILLWSIAGAGTQYGGPGMTAYKMYSNNYDPDIEIYLAHASPNQVVEDGVFKEIFLIGKPSAGKLSQLRLLAQSKKWLKTNAHKFDLFHGIQGFNTTVYPAAWFKEITGRPSVLKLAAHDSDLANKSLVLTILGNYRRRRIVAKSLDGIFAISEDIYKELVKFGFDSSKVYKISNGVDTRRYSPSTSLEKLKLREKLGMSALPVIVFMGGINKRKQPSKIVEAVAMLEKDNIYCEVYLLGPINENDELENIERIQRNMLRPENIRIVGFIKNTEEYLRAADMFALISKNEGMPNSVLEAMACRLVVLSTSISGTRDLIVSGESGFLVSPNIASVDLASTIREIIHTDCSKMTVKALELINNNYCTKKILKKHIDLFIKLSNTNPK